jgi:hypothetical protein
MCIPNEIMTCGYIEISTAVAFLVHFRFSKMASTTPPSPTKPSSKWSAKQKADSKRFVVPPSSADYKDWTVDQLKLECTAQKLSVVKNTKKE